MTRKELIEDLVTHFDELTTSDLQGIVESHCMTTGDNEDDILKEIKRVIT